MIEIKLLISKYSKLAQREYKTRYDWLESDPLEIVQKK